MKKYFSWLLVFTILTIPISIFAQSSTPAYKPTSSLGTLKPLKPGDKGPEIVLLQGFLAKQGLMPSNLLTGTYGPVTKKGVVAFQKMAGLTADGVVGSNTLFFMQNIMYPGLILKDASKDTVTYLQGLYKDSKKAGANKTKSTAKQVLTQMLSVTPLASASPSTSSNIPSLAKNVSTVLAPKQVTQIPLSVSTTQKSSLNTNNLKTFGSSQKQYTCTFTSQYTQICLPVSNVSSIQNQSTTPSSSVSLGIQSQSNTNGNSNPNINQNALQPSFTLLGQTSAINSNSSGNTAGSNNSNSSAPLYWYCNDPSCGTLSATTTPWWQTYNVAVNPEVPNACVPLSGYDIKLKLTAEDMFSVYAYKEDSKGKVTEMIPVCKDMKTSVYGVPSWKTIESCKKFKLNEDQHLALVVADDGKIAEGWIGRLEIVGNVYFSQDFAWEHIISSTKLPKTYTDFSTNQLMQEMNTGVWKPTSILGPMGIDPWGIFSDDTSLDDASWVKVQDPGQDKFSVFRLKNCGLATPASSIDLKVNNAESAVVDFGASVELDWSVNNVTSCTATSAPNNTQWTGVKSINGGTNTINTLNQNTTFTITCNSEAGQISDSVQVLVKPSVDLKVNNANTVSVAHDTPVTLSWTASNATYCAASGGSIDWEDSNNASGQINISGTFATDPLSADETYEFTITCTGSGGSVSDSVSVTVGPEPSVQLTANDTSVDYGESVTLSWIPKFVTSCTATSTPANTGWSGSKSVTDGTMTISNMTVTTEFKITCTDSFNEQVNSSVSVAVSNSPVTLTADRTTLPHGGSVWLTWTSTGATSCTASNNKNNPGWTGNKQVNSQIPSIFPIYHTTTFTLSCNTANGVVQSSVTITKDTTPISGSPSVVDNGMFYVGDRFAYYYVKFSEPVMEFTGSIVLKIKSADDAGDGDLEASVAGAYGGDILLFYADYSSNPNYNDQDLVGTGTFVNADLHAVDNDELVTNLTIPNSFSY